MLSFFDEEPPGFEGPAPEGPVPPVPAAPTAVAAAWSPRYAPVDAAAAGVAADLGGHWTEEKDRPVDPAATDRAANALFRAMDGFGTDESAIYGALAGKSPAEVAAIKAAYNERTNGRDLDADLRVELDDDDLEHAGALMSGDPTAAGEDGVPAAEKDGGGASEQLAEQARLDPALALKSAMDGAGTDVELFKKALHGKSKAEIEVIETDYDERFAPRTLKEDMGGELAISGREGFDIAEAMKGDPDKIQDPAERLKAKLAHADAAYDFERGEGAGFLDQGTRFLSETLGDGSTRSVTDLFSDSGRLMDAHHAELEAMGRKIQRGEPLSPDEAHRLSRVAGFQGDDVEGFRAAKDQVSNGAAVAGTAVVAATAAVVIEVATAGAATPAVAAAISTLAGGAGGMGLKAGLQGAGYGNDQIATDAVMTIAQAVTAGTVQSGPFLELLEAAPGGAAVLENPVLLEALKNGVQGSANAAIGGALDPRTYRTDGGGWSVARNMALAGLGGAASGAATAGMNVATQGQARLWSGALGGMAGGVAQSGVEMAATGEFDGGKLLQNVSTNAVAAMIGSMSQRHTAEELAVVPERLPAEEAAPARRPGGFVDDDPSLSEVPPELGDPPRAREEEAAPARPRPPSAEERAARVQRVSDMMEAAATTAEGRRALQILDDDGVVVTMQPGIGSFNEAGPPPRINIDPDGGTPHDLAGFLAHEAHHQATFDAEVTPHAASKEDYVAAALQNEADAQAALFEHLREAGGGATGHFGFAEYHAEYDRVIASLGPDVDPGVAASIAREAATGKVAAIVADATPSTSIRTDPVTGKPVRTGPATYREHYGEHWEKHNPGRIGQDGGS